MLSYITRGDHPNFSLLEQVLRPLVNWANHVNKFIKFEAVVFRGVISLEQEIHSIHRGFRMWYSNFQNGFTAFNLAYCCVQRITSRVIIGLQETIGIQEVKLITIANQFEFHVFKLPTLVDQIQKIPYKSRSFVEIQDCFFAQINLPEVLIFHTCFFFL